MNPLDPVNILAAPSASNRVFSGSVLTEWWGCKLIRPISWLHVTNIGAAGSLSLDFTVQLEEEMLQPDKTMNTEGICSTYVSLYSAYLYFWPQKKNNKQTNPTLILGPPPLLNKTVTWIRATRPLGIPTVRPKRT